MSGQVEQTHSDAYLARRTKHADCYRNAARRIHHQEGHLEIDHDAGVSYGQSRGAYVQCWIWIDRGDVKPQDREPKQ